MIKRLLFAIIVFFPLALSAEIIIKPAATDRIVLGKNTRANLAFDIIITDGYIYGNPVGKGIGKPTVIQIAPDAGFTVEKISIETPQKYYPENAPEWVFRYQKKARFYISLLTGGSFSGAVMKINIDALECTNQSCTPVKAFLEHRLEFSNNTTPATPDIPAGYVTLGQSNQALLNDQTQNTIEYIFTPRTADANTVSGLLLAIVFGFLAGLILNVMPCVIPVVGLKLISFIRASGESRSRLAFTGLSYTAGVFLSFTVLSLLVYSGLSWGSLFQSRYFIAVMAMIVFAMSLSLFGIFTLNIPFSVPTVLSSKNRYLSALYYGLIATLLATPCSGPFLGGTLAWTASKGYAAIFPVFMSIAAGFSFPYIIITLFPNLVRFLPKPGDWTITLEKLLGFLLAGTAVYLTVIYVTAYGTMLLWSLFIVSFSLFIYGKWGSLEKTFLIRLTSFTITLILLIASLLLLGGDVRISYSKVEYAPFSMPDLEKYRNTGTITIVDFTADWCPNCYFVEKTVLGKEEVLGFIRNNGFVLMKGDITSSGTEAEALLNALGSYSIPFLAVFVPGQGFTSPYTLRDIYTANELLALLKKAKQEAVKAQKDSSPVKVEEFKF